MRVNDVEDGTEAGWGSGGRGRRTWSRTERRQEIGIRLGGVGGIVLGIAVTGVYATTQGWPTVVPAVVRPPPWSPRWSSER
jgi:hypothetical protein